MVPTTICMQMEAKPWLLSLSFFLLPGPHLSNSPQGFPTWWCSDLCTVCSEGTSLSPILPELFLTKAAHFYIGHHPPTIVTLISRRICIWSHLLFVDILNFNQVAYLVHYTSQTSLKSANLQIQCYRLNPGCYYFT